MKTDLGLSARPPDDKPSSLTEDVAHGMWIEEGHRKPWELVAASTKERYRKRAEDELSEVFCDD